MKLDELRAAIARSASADWRVSEKPFVNLHPGSNAYLGVPEERMDHALRAASSADLLTFSSAQTPPARVDWRDRGGNWTSPVRDQGSCGACTAFALCAVMEARYRIASKRQSDPLRLSPAHVFSCGQAGGCSAGMAVADALHFAQATGVGAEDDFPYSGDDQPCRPVASRLTLANGWLMAAPMRERKLSIASEGPILATMQVFEDFAYYAGGAAYRHVDGAYLGLHAVAVVGYDDADACWIAQNSWGAAFGEGGFFRIGYGECQIDTWPVAIIEVA